MERETNVSALCNEARAIPSRTEDGRKTITLDILRRAGRVVGGTKLHLDREAAESLYRQLGAIL
jgi:hypothetical protein